jgi:zinc protease
MNRLLQLVNMPSAVADRAFAAALYGQHPYGHLAIGTMAALEGLTVKEVVAFHRQRFSPDRAVLIVVGDGQSDEVESAATAAFGGWPPRDVGSVDGDGAALAEPLSPTSRLLLVDRPGAAQSELRIGHLGVARRTPDYHALLLLNLVLGGQFVSRLNMNLRQDKGYTYGARSSFEFRLGRGPFQMQASVQTEVTAAAIREALSEVSAMRGDRPVTPAELEVARAALTRGYPRNFETADQVARSVAQLALYELPDDYFATFVSRVQELGLGAIHEAAVDHLHPDRLVTLVVGDRSRVEPTLGALALGEPSAVAAP